MQHIGFKLNDKEYTIPILKVREIIKSPALTRLPLVPDYLEGVTNLKGRVLAVVNLKKLVGLAGGITGDKVLVVGSDRVRFGFFVDSITGVINIDDSEVCRPPQGEFACSMHVSQRALMLLDTKRIIPAECISLKNGAGESLFLDPDAPAN